MASVLDVYWHDDVLLHDTGRGVFDHPPSPLLDETELHPENAARLSNMKTMLERGPLAEHLRWHPGRPAERAELEWLHDPGYVDSVRDFCAQGGGLLTWSTPVVARSWEAALVAAGSGIAATEAVLAGDTDVAYALVRPPGHHAQPAMADGYCLFSNSALAAEAARRAGVERVAVLDWDVHHGNGTQECFYERADVLTVSFHMPHGSWGPSHPQTGAPDETGRGEGEGFNVNVELPLGSGDFGYEEALAELVAPIVDRFRPGLVVVACGQDANQFDPNGRQCVTMAGFRRLGALAREVAERHCEGRMVLVQEGGYAISYAAFCLHATLEGVLGLEPSLEDPCAFMPDDPELARPGIERARAALAPHWDL